MWSIRDQRTGVAPTIGPMKLLLTFAAFCAFMRWRHERLDADDREHGYGAYAPIQPQAPTDA